MRRAARFTGHWSRATGHRPRRLAGLDSSTIATYAANAGFTGSDLDTAVAIAQAESSGNPSAYNPETVARGGTPIGKGSYGLWQIYLRDHPEFTGQNLFDPQVNANAAYSIWSRSGFTQWSTYTENLYQKYLPPLTIDNSTGQAVDDSTPTPAIPAGASTSFDVQPAVIGLTLFAVGAYLLSDFEI